MRNRIKSIPVVLVACMAAGFVSSGCGKSADADAVSVAGGNPNEKPIYVNGASTVGNFMPELIAAFCESEGGKGARFVCPASEESKSLTSKLDDKAPRGNRVWDEWQGSTWGLKLVCNGEANIGAMARRPSESELEKARAEGIAPKLHVLAFDAVAIVVHPEVATRLSHLTRTQVQGLFLSGTISTWDQLDPALPASPVRVLASNPAICGTAVAFAELVDDKWTKGKAPEEYYAGSVEFRELPEVVEAVSKDPLALGFCQFSMIPDDASVSCVAYLDDQNVASQKPVVPSVESCSDGSYTLQRPLLLVTNGTPTGVMNRFIRFAMGPEGKQILQSRSCIVPR